MTNSIYTSLISITKGLHRDNRNERDFRYLNSKINENSNSSHKVNPLYIINFPVRAIGDKRKYFKTIIDKETINKFNYLIEQFPDNAIIQENQFSYAQLYADYRKNLISINSYIKNHGHIRDNLNNENTYVIQYLKTNMIWLFLELQERYSEFGNEDILSIEEVYNYYFNEYLDIYDIKRNLSPSIDPLKKNKLSIKKVPTKKVSFGYKYRDAKELLNVITLLQLKIDLLDESRTSVEDFVNLLIAKNYTTTKYKIYLFCETTQFRYIIDTFKPHFTNFTPTAVETSKAFFTKNNIQLKASNLYKNKAYEPKAKADIDSIIDKLK